MATDESHDEALPKTAHAGRTLMADAGFCPSTTEMGPKQTSWLLAMSIGCRFSADLRATGKFAFA
jgi:hypothetical protein